MEHILSRGAYLVASSILHNTCVELPKNLDDKWQPFELSPGVANN